MRTACLLALVTLIVPSSVVASPAPRRGAEPRVIQLDVGDNMKYVPAAITAAPGESIKVVIRHVGQMPKVAMGHNFVLLKKGVDARKLADKCSSARDTEFILPAVKDELLASTRLVGPGETADVTFVAPAARGEYTFICTFPGHFAVGMKGILTVK
jgi:azurin